VTFGHIGTCTSTDCNRFEGNCLACFGAEFFPVQLLTIPNRSEDWVESVAVKIISMDLWIKRRLGLTDGRRLDLGCKVLTLGENSLLQNIARLGF
jgi:hypothetical protein